MQSLSPGTLTRTPQRCSVAYLKRHQAVQKLETMARLSLDGDGVCGERVQLRAIESGTQYLPQLDQDAVKVTRCM